MRWRSVYAAAFGFCQEQFYTVGRGQCVPGHSAKLRPAEPLPAASSCISTISPFQRDSGNLREEPTVFLAGRRWPHASAPAHERNACRRRRIPTGAPLRRARERRSSSWSPFRRSNAERTGLSIPVTTPAESQLLPRRHPVQANNSE
jgi:hypothetical protein